MFLYVVLIDKAHSISVPPTFFLTFTFTPTLEPGPGRTSNHLADGSAPASLALLYHVQLLLQQRREAI